MMLLSQERQQSWLNGYIGKDTKTIVLICTSKEEFKYKIMWYTVSIVGFDETQCFALHIYQNLYILDIGDFFLLAS